LSPPGINKGVVFVERQCEPFLTGGEKGEELCMRTDGGSLIFPKIERSGCIMRRRIGEKFKNILTAKRRINGMRESKRDELTLK